MSLPTTRNEDHAFGHGVPGTDGGATPDRRPTSTDTDGPLAAPVQDRFRFESLLAELSATFVHLPADRVDSRIESALEQLVAFLGVDRGGLAQLPGDKDDLVITHSHHRPGVPPLPASSSPAAGKPASIESIPASASARAIAALSSGRRRTSGICSPSRSVVSDRKTCCRRRL